VYNFSSGKTKYFKVIQVTKVTLSRRALQADSVIAFSMRFAFDIKRSSPTICNHIKKKLHNQKPISVIRH